jgi:WD40 repeat protein
MFALAVQPALAAPGDTFNAESKWTEKPASKRQFRKNDSPEIPEGFKIKKSVSNLGEITALAIVNNDVFAADSAQGRITRLKSRNANGNFDVRAEYLIGFNKIYDLAAAQDILFISDNTGIWQSNVGQMLVAPDVPRLIYSNPSPLAGNKISIAVLPDGKTLVVGNGGNIVALDTATQKQKQISRGPWRVQDVAVSPTGSIWASVSENGSSYILPIRSEAEGVARLALPPHSNATDIRFWNKENFPENWPVKWGSDLFFSIDGNQPMLARAHFNFGDISSEFTAFVDGFSTPSPIVGRREYWGVPTALEILPNGQLIFAEREQGSLWVLEKEPETKEKLIPLMEAAEIPETETVLEKKPVFPILLKGSSIKSASGLETDELLKAPKQEKDKDN